jgi:hypothetical protein
VYGSRIGRRIGSNESEGKLLPFPGCERHVHFNLNGRATFAQERLSRDDPIVVAAVPK